jgi:hypothetical protein
MTHRISKQTAGTSSRSCLARISQRLTRTTNRFARIIFMTITSAIGSVRMRFKKQLSCARATLRLALAMPNHRMVKTNFKVALALS